MPTRVAQGATAPSRSASAVATAKPKRKSSLGGKVIAPTLKRKDAFDTSKTRGDGSLVLGRRNLGPGEVTLSKKGELLLEGKKGPAALIETARLIEMGVSPFSQATDTQRSDLVDSLIKGVEHPKTGKASAGAVLARSAAATLLLSLVRTSDGKTRETALNGYLGVLDRETHLPLKASLFTNLDAAHLTLKKTQVASVDAAREVIAPSAPPYEKWFKGQAKPHFEVRQYVMSDFWREEAAGNRARGFKAVSEKPNEIIFEKVLKDPNGVAPDTTARIVMRKDDENVLRDIDDPKVNMIIYSGHAQLGGVADQAVRKGPAHMKGDKLVALFNCRGQQNVAEFKEKYPAAHLSATFSSSYGSDDGLVMDKLFETIASRGSYSDTRASLKPGEMLQPKSNYILPDDPRQVAFHDDDIDGVRNTSAIGTDKFFDPGTRRALGGAHVFRPSAVSEDPQELSGVKLDHAIGYANTAFFYFAEENSAAPINLKQADHFIPGGWFVSDTDEPVRVTEKTKNGETYYDVAVNSRYADKSREVITSMVLMELQKYLSNRNDGGFDKDDKMRGLVMVAAYLDLQADYSDTIDEVLKGFAQKYGFTGTVDYALMFQALKREGDEGTGERATLDYLKSRGIAVG